MLKPENAVAADDTRRRNPLRKEILRRAVAVTPSNIAARSTTSSLAQQVAQPQKEEFAKQQRSQEAMVPWRLQRAYLPTANQTVRRCARAHVCVLCVLSVCVLRVCLVCA